MFLIKSGQFGKFYTVHELWTIYSTRNGSDTSKHTFVCYIYDIHSYQCDVRTLGMVPGQIIVKKWSKQQKVALIQEYHIQSIKSIGHLGHINDTCTKTLQYCFLQVSKWIKFRTGNSQKLMFWTKFELQTCVNCASLTKIHILNLMHFWNMWKTMLEGSHTSPFDISQSSD